jgi:hypothetical protein
MRVQKRNTFAATPGRRRIARIAALLRPFLLLALIGSARGPAPVQLSAFCVANDSGDDTGCIRAWVAAATAVGATLAGSPGTYNYNAKVGLVSDVHLVCATNHRTRFRNTGGSALFFEAMTDVQNVHIEGCDFDVNGNPTNFLTVIGINPGTPTRSRKVEILNNRFYDSKITGRMSAAQRQYVLLLNCDFCSVIGNRLTEGGRIKVGRPGSDITIMDNRLENVNDNAITVVDNNGGGISARINITNNHIRNPKGVGIFFGVDGESETDPALVTRDVVIENNEIAGDWTTACILGTLPATASGVKILRNKCSKTGQCGDFAAGIALKRANNSTVRATTILIDNNEVESSVGWIAGQLAPLDMGGVFISGLFDNLTVTNNRVTSVGTRAIYFTPSADVTNATVTNNTMKGGTLRITGTVAGITTPNTTLP